MRTPSEELRKLAERLERAYDPQDRNAGARLAHSYAVRAGKAILAAVDTGIFVDDAFAEIVARQRKRKPPGSTLLDILAGIPFDDDSYQNAVFLNLCQHWLPGHVHGFKWNATTYGGADLGFAYADAMVMLADALDGKAPAAHGRGALKGAAKRIADYIDQHPEGTYSKVIGIALGCADSQVRRVFRKKLKPLGYRNEKRAGSDRGYKPPLLK